MASDSQGATRPAASVAERVAALGYDPAAQPSERVAACNLCGTVEHPIRLARRDRYGYPTSFVLCAACGLGYLSPRLTAAAYAEFYANTYRPLVSAYHGRRIDADTLHLDQRPYATELAHFLAPHLPRPPHTILDVGGSTGIVAAVLADRFDASATVVDPAPDELDIARAAGLETITGMAEDYDPGHRTWDLVLLCQTIDHLLDIRSTLSVLRRMTAPGGRAFIDIVDLGIMLQRTGSIEAAIKIDHPYYLTARTAHAYFSLAGYQTVAERTTDDGHRGFILAPTRPRAPDWPAVRTARTELLTDIWATREAASCSTT